MAKQFLWITNTEENLLFYANSAPKSNLSLHFSSEIDENTKKKIKAFVRYLRKTFFFPIRCNVYFCNQEKFHSSKGGYCYGIFFSGNQSNRRVYPQIYIPVNNEPYAVYHAFCHELTHYFQWYFLDDEEKNDRSLEVQASKYATRVLEDYCSWYCKEPDHACKDCCGG